MEAGMRTATKTGIADSPEMCDVSSVTATRRAARSEFGFAGVALLFIVLAATITTTAPVAVSVVIVFLFAGPHNYAEARYFLTRLPARMGRLKPFFLLSVAGIISLTIGFPLLARIPLWFQWPAVTAIWLIGLWNTAFILWCTALISLRSQQSPRRDWDYAWPVGLAVVGLTWLAPAILPLLLVYAHPLMGLWILDRELQKSHPEWRRPFRFCVLLLPVVVAVQWSAVGGMTAGGWQVPQPIHEQIVRHSGTAFFSEDVGQRLIATHAFLELLHYGVWLIAVPIVSGRVFSEAFAGIPLMRRSGAMRKSIRTILAASAILVAALWLGFAADYSTTRDVYFTVATLHVLAEIPFLLRLL
jgi:hypothetical protein